MTDEIRIDLTVKEDKSNKVIEIVDESTDTQYPSAKAVYDELMTVRTVTPSIDTGGSSTMNNVTKNWHYSDINSSDLEYFEKIVYNITFEDNDFQTIYQVIPSMGGGSPNFKMIYFDGTDCYWGIPNNEDLTKGSLICEGNTLQATLNKDMTITIGDTITNWEVDGEVIMFGNVDFTYTIYSRKYLDNETFPYVFEDQEAYNYPDVDYTINSVTKTVGEYSFHGSSLNNIIEATYTFTFNDNDFSFIEINHDYIIFFDGTDCYWGEMDENDYTVMHKGTLICEGNVVQGVHKSTDGSNGITFSDGTSTYFSEQYYFGDVSVKMRSKAPKLEYATNKKNSLSVSYYDESIVYPSVSAVKNYAEDKTNKVTSLSSSSTDAQYPSAKLLYNNIIKSLSLTDDGKLYLITQEPNTVTLSPTGTQQVSNSGYIDLTVTVKDNNNNNIEGIMVEIQRYETGYEPIKTGYTNSNGVATIRMTMGEYGFNGGTLYAYSGNVRSTSSVSILVTIDDFDIPL